MVPGPVTPVNIIIDIADPGPAAGFVSGNFQGKQHSIFHQVRGTGRIMLIRVEISQRIDYRYRTGPAAVFRQIDPFTGLDKFGVTADDDIGTGFGHFPGKLTLPFKGVINILSPPVRDNHDKIGTGGPGAPDIIDNGTDILKGGDQIYHVLISRADGDTVGPVGVSHKSYLDSVDLDHVNSIPLFLAQIGAGGVKTEPAHILQAGLQALHIPVQAVIVGK